MNKHNNFVKFLKKINLSINSLLEKYLNKLNFNNLSNIARSNKIFLIFVAFTILFLSYLSIPHIYNKTEIKKELRSQLLDNFNTNFIFSNNFKYKFFPRPQFIIEDSSIIYNQAKISDVKKLRIYISLNNLLSLKNISIKDLILENSNFNFDKNNYNFFTKLLDNNFLESSFKIKDSNIFYRNKDNEVLLINKIVSMKYYYDSKKLKNIVYSENEIFNIPFSFNSHINKEKEKIFTKIKLNLLNIQIENELKYSGSSKKGLINLIYNKNKSKITYEFNKNYFIFNFMDKLVDSKFVYEGEINFNPFYSIFKGNVEKLNLSPLFRLNSLSTQLFKTEILNNKNLNIDLKVNAKKIAQFKNFINIFLNFKIQEGLIDIDNTKFSWNNYVDFKILDSLIYVNKNQLILDSKLIVNIKNYNEIYKFLQISKNLRPEIKKLEFDFNYNFDEQIIGFKNIKINNESSEKINNLMKKIILKKDKLQNKIYFKNILKQAITDYVG